MAHPILSNYRSDLSSYDSDPETHDFDFDPIFEHSGCDYYSYGDDQVSFVTNLFDRSAENGLNCNTQVGFELGSCNSEIDLELGLGLGVGSSPQPAEEGRHFEGLRVVGVDSESDSEDGFLGDFDRPPICWDYLGFNNRRNDDRIHTHESEIELSQIVDDDESIPFDSYQETEDQEVLIQSDSDDGGEFGVDEAIRDLDWEILLAVNNFNREVSDMGFNVDMYEAILGEVEDRINNSKGNPPASLSIIENLPTVCLSREISEQKNVFCAICKDEVSEDEIVRQLPCLHYYHGECIVPWLKIRNSCPVCRHELPTDDPEYEFRKWQREEEEEEEDHLSAVVSVNLLTS